MGEIELSLDHTIDVTIISNSFIEKYMADANGAFVKVYLYLIYCVQNKLTFSISSACDFLGDTEKDVIRALNYWEKVGLISIHRNEKYIVSIKLNDTNHIETAEIAHFIMNAPKKAIAKPQNNCKEEELTLIMSVTERYIERLLSSSDINLICELYEKIGFPADLIIYLYEHCAEKGKTDFKYIEKVAYDWADKGIKTIEQAKDEVLKFSELYHSVRKALGINRPLGDIELKYLSNWTGPFKMPLEMIVEACNRTLIQISRPDFKYVEGILKKWKDASCFSLSDLSTLDKIQAAKNNVAKNNLPEATKVNTRFNAFPQRNYSEETFKQIEKKLINNK